MKTKPFPSGVHLVSLKGDTSPTDFLAAFKYENRNLEYIDPSIMNGAEDIGLLKKSDTIGKLKKTINTIRLRPLQAPTHGGDDPKLKTFGSISTLRKLDFTKDCCPIVLLPHCREEGERLINDLHRLAFEHSATIFVFFSYPLEDLYKMQKLFTSILTYDKSTKGGTVKKGAGDMHKGPYTIDQPPVTKRDAPWEDPAPKPTETATKISDLVKTCGFHQTSVSVFNADALLRGDKTDLICSAYNNVQKGDWIVPIIADKPSHALNHTVWEVTFVTYIRQSEEDNGYGQVALSIRRLPNARFEKGDIAGPYLADCIVTTYP